MRTLSLALCCTIFIGCAQHAPFRYNMKDKNVEITGPVQLHGISRVFGQLYSFSSVSGDRLAAPDDMIPVFEAGSISFSSLPENREQAVDWLTTACCTPGQTVTDMLASQLEWVDSLFGSPSAIETDVYLLPEDVGYKIRSRFPIKSGQSQVVFAFKLYDDLQPIENLSNITDTLAHELTHAYFNVLGGKPDSVSNETLASLVEVCVVTRLTGDVPKSSTNINLDITFTSQTTGEDETLSDIGQRISDISEEKYFSLVNGLSDLPATLQGSIFADFILTDLRRHHTDGDALKAKLLSLCEMAVPARHDIRTSLYPVDFKARD